MLRLSQRLSAVGWRTQDYLMSVRPFNPRYRAVCPVSRAGDPTKVLRSG